MISSPDNEAALRQPDARELALLGALLNEPFEGGAVLRQQVHGLRVRTLLRDGTIEMVVRADAPRADVAERVPVEATYDDDDGVPVLVLLHVVGGRMSELEVVKADGSAISLPPTVQRLRRITRSAA